MVEARYLVMAPMLVHHTRLWMVKSIPARSQSWTGEKIAEAAQAQMNLQTSVPGLA